MKTISKIRSEIAQYSGISAKATKDLIKILKAMEGEI
jgi:hypothetical protein